MKFCSACGAPVIHRIPEGDSLPRHVCTTCDTVHYENPKLVVGTVPEWEDQVLLCRRAIEPRLGFWTLPAGFLENGESAAEGATRETLEEANARVEILELYSFFDLTHINQIHLMFRANLIAPEFSAGAESLEVKLFKESEIPWDDIAFRTVRETLRRYFEDRKTGIFQFQMRTLPPPIEG